MKRLYHILALLALIQLFALAGFVGFLFATGRLTAERMDKIGAILRGEGSQAAELEPAAATQPAKPETATSEIARNQYEQEMVGMMAERQRRELEDMARLGQTIQFEVEKRLEEIKRREQQFQDQKRELAKQQEQDGFERELEVLSAITPALARGLLREKNDADVVRLFMKMDASRVRKIINTCKTQEEKDWAGRILGLLQAQGNSQFDAEASDARQTLSGG